MRADGTGDVLRICVLPCQPNCPACKLHSMLTHNPCLQAAELLLADLSKRSWDLQQAVERQPTLMGRHVAAAVATEPVLDFLVRRRACRHA